MFTFILLVVIIDPPINSQGAQFVDPFLSFQCVRCDCEVNLSEDAIWPVRVHAVIVSPQSHSVPMLISVTYLVKIWCEVVTWGENWNGTRVNHQNSWLGLGKFVRSLFPSMDRIIYTVDYAHLCWCMCIHLVHTYEERQIYMALFICICCATWYGR